MDPRLRLCIPHAPTITAAPQSRLKIRRGPFNGYACNGASRTSSALSEMALAARDHCPVGAPRADCRNASIGPGHPASTSDSLLCTDRALSMRVTLFHSPHPSRIIWQSVGIRLLHLAKTLQAVHRFNDVGDQNGFTLAAHRVQVDAESLPDPLD